MTTEAKAEYKQPADGLQQAMDYAEILGVRFAYSTNGLEIVEYDYTTGREQTLDAFPSPDELWRRLQTETQKELDALMPSILAKAFAGEL